jgi:hypothetical protein
MRKHETDGYYNVACLKQFMAIELSNYEEKEKLLHDVFEKHRVDKSELFALNKDVVKELLLSLEGKIIYPQDIKPEEKEKVFKKTTEKRRQGEKFNFFNKGIKIGDKITFKDDHEIIATVISNNEVEFNGITYLLSTLALELHKTREHVNNSKSYRGAAEFLFNGTILTKLPDNQ